MENRPKVGVGVIVEKDGKVLLGERLASHGAGTWMLPGGHLEFGESFEDCARREVQEETGLTDLSIKDVVSVANDIMYETHYVTVGILAGLQSGDPVLAEPGKTGEWQWFSPEEMPDNLFVASKNILDNWREGKVYRG